MQETQTPILKVLEQSLLDVEEGLLIHSVNTRGIMGGGVALAIRNAFPNVYDEYRGRFWELGDVQFVQAANNPKIWVCNLAGQKDLAAAPGDVATNPAAFREGLIQVRQWLEEQATEGNVLQPYAPYEIGCGLGGGDWQEISAILQEELPGVILCKRPK